MISKNSSLKKTTNDGIPIIITSTGQNHTLQELSTPNEDDNNSFTCRKTCDSDYKVILENPTYEKEKFSWKKLWAFSGPGWMLSIAFLDPGNLESDLQGGGYASYSVTWILFWSTFMAWFLQVLSVKLGVVTGLNLAETCRENYPKWISRVIWIMTEIAIIGSDIQEVLGCSIALQILFNLDLWIGCILTGLGTFVFLYIGNFGIRKLEAFFVLLILVMLVSFFLNLGKTGVDVNAVAHGLVPSVEKHTTQIIVAIIGAVIMPQNIFLHSALVKSRNIDPKNLQKVKEANKYFGIESAIALFVSFLINFAVLGVFASAFYSTDCSHTYNEEGINTACLLDDASLGKAYGPCKTLYSNIVGVCKEIGLDSAGTALKAALGNYGETFWAIGLLASGQTSTMTGTYAGQFVMEGFLNMKVVAWKRALFTRSVALIPAVVVAIISDSKPGFSDEIGQWLNVLQSIQLPFALLPILHFTCERKLMNSMTNNFWMSLTGWGIGFFVCVVNVYLLYTKATEYPLEFYWHILIASLTMLYGYVLVSLIKADFLRLGYWMFSSCQK